jgi:hypothetical protein
MSDREFGQIKRDGLTESARPAYDEEAALRRRYAGMPDSDLSVVNEHDLIGPELACYHREAKRRSAVGEFIVRPWPITGAEDFRLPTNAIVVVWPRYCARCGQDGPVGSATATTAWTEIVTVIGGRQRVTHTLSWAGIPVCRSCLPFGVASYVKAMSAGAADHYFTFANGGYGVRFKIANEGSYYCSGCNQGVAEKDAYCPNCDLRQPSRLLDFYGFNHEEALKQEHERRRLGSERLKKDQAVAWDLLVKDRVANGLCYWCGRKMLPFQATETTPVGYKHSNCRQSWEGSVGFKNL